MIAVDPWTDGSDDRLWDIEDGRWLLFEIPASTMICAYTFPKHSF